MNTPTTPTDQTMPTVISRYLAPLGDPKWEVIKDGVRISAGMGKMPQEYLPFLVGRVDSRL